jgi:hypothetical protein
MRRLLAATTALALAAPLLAQAPAVPLIERAKLFGNPSKTGGRISPDGKWLSWIAPRDGVLNIWVAPAGDPAAAKPLTAEKARPIRQYYWSPDSSMILFVNDKGGDENFLLYGVDVATGTQKNLTPFDKTRVEIINVSHEAKDRILIGLNNRDARWHDVYSLDLKTGKLTLVLQNAGGYAGYIADEQLVPRIAQRATADGGAEFFRIINGKVDAKAFATIGLEDALSTAPAGFTTDGKTLYWLDSRGRDTAAVVAQDMATNKTSVVAEDPRADIGSVMADKKTGVIQAWSVDYLRNEWKASDPAIGRDLAWLKDQLKGDVFVTSRTDADDKWTVAVDPVVKSSSTWLYDRKAHKLTQLFVSRPELEGAPLVAMYPVPIKARDGLTLVSYLTLPPGADPDGDGKPNRPVPLVLFVHGGPVARQSRLCRARGQLSRIDRLREEIHQRGRSAMGPQDARRSARRGRLGGRAGCYDQGQGGDRGRVLWRLCDARRRHLYARRLPLRRRYRRAVQPVHIAPDDPALLGGRQAAILPAHGQPHHRGGQGIAARTLASVHGRPDQGAAADRPGAERSARQRARERADRRGDESQGHSGDVRRLPRRRPRLRAPGQQYRLQRHHREFPVDLPWGARRADRRCAQAFDRAGEGGCCRCAGARGRGEIGREL